MAAWSELYLDDARKNFGELTEYAAEISNVQIGKCLRYFVISGFAARWEKGDVRLLCGLSGTELWQRVLETCGLPLPQSKEALVRYETDASYWWGYMLAYYQWSRGHSFQTICTVFTDEDYIRLYPALHTASEQRTLEEFDKLFSCRRQMTTRLSEYRKNLGLTQKQLAQQAGVNLRTLEEYESNRKDLRKAAAGTVASLASVLHTTSDALLA